ncbi:histone-lysine N-methyltransferase SETDB1 [Athalia rosae]|uniref:histone-lysine N-methyltransferase SETDB1 n=1 Tax=Athalia rosae TaxID=37344 RepID=UPI002034201E|nr:histone-lysine N-methyltransferase SETDB1 [Athalia rosae]XP_048516339.1 histone-lysine N-methyltransferase SETDB1 [Athalia rosae]XP_048516340.1 histone-lysine N-methyltransferase SETDB1 [Athalia rosae]XP_048516341.1 histone-lysine N-methyltransferase SETDB1 [Athalia rosae]XP_048516342.1 histone-lysine N-methyltransferase SETDB1 [Athalia rosae]
MAGVQDMEIIELVSDEEQHATRNKRVKSKGCTNNCINFKCKSGVNMKPAPSFACLFYGSTSNKKKKHQICEECLDVVLNHQEELADCLVNRKPLLECEFPDHTMEVEISDSDDSSNEEMNGSNEEDDYVPEDVVLDIEEKVDSALTMIFEKYDIDFQIEQAHKVLEQQWNKIDENNQRLDKDLSKMISEMDRLRNSLYDDFKPQIRMLPELDADVETTETLPFPLVATKKVTQMRIVPPALPDSQPEILPCDEIEAQVDKVDLPPAGLLKKSTPEVSDAVFVMKHPLMAWVEARVQSVVSRAPSQYRVKITSKKSQSVTRVVRGTQLALATPSPVLIPVGTRVVAIFTDISCQGGYFSGVVAEPPKSTNKYRYLIFFDDGYAQYITHKHILIVNEWSSRVWEDIPKESQDFVKKYMESYPERPMVKLQPGQLVKTEWNAKWWIAKVISIDASLVQMHFNADRRTEWIYRGSTRLGPLYDELLKANARQQGHHALLNSASHRFPSAVNRSSLPYVEYTSNVEPEEELKAEADKSQKVMELRTSSGATSISIGNEAAEPAPTQSRAVAKKSTSKRQFSVENTNFNTITTSTNNTTTTAIPTITSSISTGSNTKPSHSIVYYQTQNKIQTRKFVPHKCSSRCVEGISFTPDDLRGYSPLSIPLLCGWNRQLCKFPKMKKVILYQAPCGIRLRTIEELHLYLRVTGSPMSVDLFDFDYWVHCLAEFVLDKCFVNIKDLSYGVENVPIPCVNELDHALPDTIKYSTQRQPMEGVHLNLDPEFLCGCNCEDDCQDKEKCACWQLTIQGATLGGRMPDTAVGYVYKRLPEAVATGIYECNSRCKCSVKTCLNRVVQHPLTLKLQVFKTGPRGWGIRCLNDIPHGSFICIYAGTLLTEQGANEGGKNYGDEYLAELDYVEAVEGIKEGYESDVMEPEEPEEKVADVEAQPQPVSEDEDTTKEAQDSDEDFNIGKKINLDVDPATSIRKRLRKRKKDENDDRIGSEDTSEDGSLTKDSESSSGKATSTNQDDRRVDCDLITISDDEDDGTVRREPSRFEPTVEPTQLGSNQSKSVREYFGEDEAVYIMDAKTTGNIGRYLNHSCDPNVFVQNVFVDTHDVRFPWVAFFALNYIRSGQELTWNYNYDVGSIPGKVIICRCGSSNCRGRLL